MYCLLNRVNKMSLNGCIDYNLSLAVGGETLLSRQETFEVSNSGTMIKLYMGFVILDEEPSFKT